MLKRILTPFASLKLTVVLLAMSMVLIYAGTWAQIDSGIWQVQDKYFHSFWCWIKFQTMLPRPAPGHRAVPGGFPMLGGMTVGLLLLINLLAAHTVRFKFNKKRIGIIMIHFGIVLLLVGEGISAGMRSESKMRIEGNGTAQYAFDDREVEFAVVDNSPKDYDDVAIIHEHALKEGALIHDPKLPFDLRIDAYYPNADILGPMQPGKKDARATAGGGVGVTLVSLPRAGGTESRVDAPGAYVTPIINGKPAGTYLVWTYYISGQDVKVGDKTYNIALRFKREYKPYTVQLLKFTHARYTGTDTPKDFASTVRLVDPANHTDREARIWMNHPLRYSPSGNLISGGETFYQASFLPNDTGTILEVVQNPGWLLPYAAVGITGIGLVIHFLMMLVKFIDRQMDIVQPMPPDLGRSASPQGGRREYQLDPRPAWMRWDVMVPIACAVVCLLYLGSLIPAPSQEKFDLEAFGKLPISYEGRVQPLDSLARNSLRGISNHETLTVDGVKRPAIQWLLDVFGKSEKSGDYKIFRVDHPEVKSLLGDDEKKYFSFRDIVNHGQKVEAQFKMLPEDEHNLDPYQRKLLDLRHKTQLYMQLVTMDTLFAVPPSTPGGDWAALGKAPRDNAGFKEFERIIDAWQNDDAIKFNSAVTAYQARIDRTLPIVSRHVGFEHFYDRFEPFVQCIYLYVVAFLLVAVSWMAARKVLWRSALAVLAVTFLIHTLGLVARIYISGRPPVTNLAASAIFIGWAATAFCLGLELLFRNGLGTAVAAVLGAVTLLISHQLSLDGDNMKVLQAVLDTNFWLATHVVAVTIGYSATVLAGCFGLVYIVMRLFSPEAAMGETGKTVTKMTYGIVCFAMLFSFVGTILGGIWADQSWGRFWGWDPKENGAVLIVLANALLLHARWGGIAKARGIACLSVFGIMVTGWSWFGTNMLGVGLHAYGFIDSALFVLLAVEAGMALIIAAAFLPVDPNRGAPPCGPGFELPVRA